MALQPYNWHWKFKCLCLLLFNGNLMTWAKSAHFVIQAQAGRWGWGWVASTEHPEFCGMDRLMPTRDFFFTLHFFFLFPFIKKYLLIINLKHRIMWQSEVLCNSFPHWENIGVLFFNFLFFCDNFFLKKIFELEENCFTMLCWFMSYNNADQL